MLLLLLAAAGCSERVREEKPRTEIVVAAASNFSEAFEELGQQYTTRTGVRVTNSFGATAQLTKQIESGAPFDVFASADVQHLDELKNKNLLAVNSPVLFARGALVLWMPEEKGSPIRELSDLTKSDVTAIAIARPELAPYGQAAVETLRAMNLWERVEPKVVYAPNVAQAKQFAATKNADAAFIPLSLTKDGVGRYLEIDPRLYGPLDHGIAVLRGSQKQKEAREFVGFVLSEEGQALLKKYGYGEPSNVSERPR
ncbi:MAG: molybdate ABC transporter substrate-binding protein [Pyrinomonadaceae bacterium]